MEITHVTVTAIMSANEFAKVCSDTIATAAAMFEAKELDALELAQNVTLPGQYLSYAMHATDSYQVKLDCDSDIFPQLQAYAECPKMDRATHLQLEITV